MSVEEKTSKGIEYWKGVDATVNGMLGGFPTISRTDIQGSKTFLARLGIGIKVGRKTVPRVLEGGAGIGRVTKGLLIGIGDQIDIIEPVARFTEQLQREPGVGRIFNDGLEFWQPPQGVVYDLIWLQWCVIYLDDESLVRFLETCKTVLNPDGGIIVLKDNISINGLDIPDDEDGGVTRGHEKFLSIIKQAGLRLIRTEAQHGFPVIHNQQLLPVQMYAMEPMFS